ncbi:MAG: YafY family protein [Ancalomicrobiaceae bacterium]|nr:YafY family protein [Ancalomicrobiaceae bacterium]
MSRAGRLLQLMQILRRHRHPVSGAVLAGELGVSLRTLYRDIAALQGQGADIAGEPGLGYVLKPGFLLPPLMFSAEEIEALALGSQWVADRADPRLALAAREAMAKIAAVLPRDLADMLESSGLVVPSRRTPALAIDLAVVRQAIRAEKKLDIAYRDAVGAETARVIWPIALAFFEQVRVIVAWCELRQDFRSFRADRIAAIDVAVERYPKRRMALLKEWRLREEARERCAPPQPGK